MSLPEGTGTPTAMAVSDGFLTIGTNKGHLLFLNALRPDAILETVQLSEPVIGIEPTGEANREHRGAPALIVTTRRSVLRVDLVPEVRATILWTAPSQCAQVALPVGEGVLVFSGDPKGAEISWVGLDAGVVPQGTMGGPVGKPVPLSDDRALVFGSREIRIIEAEAAHSSRSVPSSLTLVTTVPAARLAATGDVYLAYADNSFQGIARYGAVDGSLTRCTDATFRALKFLPIDRQSVVVASSTDLQVVEARTGESRWSLVRNCDTSETDFTLFAPVGAEGHILLHARGQHGGSWIVLMPLNAAALAEGPRTIVEVRQPLLPPAALPGGVAVVHAADGIPKLLVTQAKERDS